ncbi:MAG: extracellular solute-binding protein [Thermoplasmatales archaeon]
MMARNNVRKKEAILALLIVFFVLGVSVGYFVPNHQVYRQESISTFAAGSLTYVLGDQFNPEFQNLTGIKVGMTFGGSISGTRQVQSGAPYSVFISASAAILYDNLMNQTHYSNWQILFATNEMAITWLSKSYAIPSTFPFWFENLTENSTTLGVSNASLDPSGFQAIETMKLAGILYTNWSNPYVRAAFKSNESLFLEYNKAWNSWFGKLGYPPNDSMALYHQIFITKYERGYTKLTTEEYGLNAYLESGAVDYAITYVSQAINQGLYYYQNLTGSDGLPIWVNLGSINGTVDSFYQKINASGPGYDNVGNIPGAPILYSLTIISNYFSEQALQYVYDLITAMGTKYLTEGKFSPLQNPIGVGINNMPMVLRTLVVNPPSYLPYSAYN